jgi:thiol-disulfide isomerase/thioredoxin
VGEAADGRPLGDWSSLTIDADGDGKATRDVDRIYSLNPWPQRPGLHYSVVFDDRGTSGLTADSKGRGAVSYVGTGEGKRVRVDSYLVPLAELQTSPGKPLRFAFWGSSPTPKLVVNSVGFASDKPYYTHNLPRDRWHQFTLADRLAVIDVQAVPEGRGTITIEGDEARAMPEVGAAPPEVIAGAWLNWAGKEAPSLAGLKGKVVVVEFWATWCGPCVAGIPHLNEIHEKYAGRGLVLLSLTDQGKAHIEEFMQKRPMKYTLGVRSNAAQEYGVKAIPYAFVIGRDGKVSWHGYSNEDEFEAQIKAALGAG